MTIHIDPLLLLMLRCCAGYAAVCVPCFIAIMIAMRVFREDV